MKKINRARSSSLFLLELIIAILFFSIASAVCVQFFVKSHNMSQDAQDLNFAVNECCSIAEIIQTSDGQKAAADSIKNLYPDVAVSQSDDVTECSIFFDSSFNPCPSDNIDCSYCVKADLKTEDGMITCDIEASETAGDNHIYELEVKHNAQSK